MQKHTRRLGSSDSFSSLESRVRGQEKPDLNRKYIYLSTLFLLQNTAIVRRKVLCVVSV